MPPEDEEELHRLQNQQAFRPGETPEERAKRLESYSDNSPDATKDQ